MNQRIKNTIFFFSINVVFFFSAFAQEGGYRLPASEKIVPKVVVEVFKEQYPNCTLKSWYITHLTYWQHDCSSDWYTKWYNGANVVVFTYNYEVPNYFEVEFSEKPTELSRAIYNKYGFWHETRTQVKGLPLAVVNALKESKYAEWKVSVLKERIETPDWPVEIYRFQVSKGIRAEIIRMDKDGNIVQAKYIGE